MKDYISSSVRDLPGDDNKTDSGADVILNV